jgi:hypothetical protein
MMHCTFLVIVLLTMSFSQGAAVDTAAIKTDGKAVVTVTLLTGWSSVMSGEKIGIAASRRSASCKNVAVERRFRG